MLNKNSLLTSCGVRFFGILQQRFNYFSLEIQKRNFLLMFLIEPIRIDQACLSYYIRKSADILFTSPRNTLIICCKFIWIVYILHTLIIIYYNYGLIINFFLFSVASRHHQYWLFVLPFHSHNAIYCARI